MSPSTADRPNRPVGAESGDRPLVTNDRPLSELPLVRRRHLGRSLAAAAILAMIAQLIYVVATNPRFEWHVVGHYFTGPTILAGIRTTLELTALCMAVSTVFAVGVAAGRLSPNLLIRSACWWFIWFFRGVPLLVQIIFIFNLAALFPVLHFGLPFGGPTVVTANPNELITPFIASFLALTLNQVAFSAEIIRGGLLSVDEGQSDAAGALGMTRLQTLSVVVLPQAVPAIIPPLGNETISMLKNTSLVSVVALSDLLYATQAIYSATYETIPLLIVASLWYLIMVSILTVAQRYVERHFQRGFRSSQDRRAGLVGSVRRLLVGVHGS